mmetsp:Transcript_27907/g.64850  ORF Transcript_27907/g.64850 Transcript_27907/m.64850 type:complete len:232 (+) Transcript_27907:367-1062(+)
MKLPKTGVKVVKNTGMLKANAPDKKTSRVPYSTPMALLSEAKSKPPKEMLHIRMEKTKPVGSGLPCSTPSMVGTHMKTKEYIEPSKKELTSPTSKTLRSLTIRAKPFAPNVAVRRSSPSASSPPAPPDPPSVPWFSLHLHTRGMATIVKKIAAWKGPISPLASAQTCAKIPAAIAARPLPKEPQEKLSASHSSGNPRALCSDTIQDSKAENNKEVLTPPATLDNSSTGKLL